MSDPDAEPLSLPDVRSEMLDAATLRALFRDLLLVAKDLTVTLKGHATARTDGKPRPLSEAANALESGSALGVQLRYHHAGRAWCDTLIRTPHGIRLVRIAEDALRPS